MIRRISSKGRKNVSTEKNEKKTRTSLYLISQIQQNLFLEEVMYLHYYIVEWIICDTNEPRFEHLTKEEIITGERTIDHFATKYCKKISISNKEEDL